MPQDGPPTFRDEARQRAANMLFSAVPLRDPGGANAGEENVGGVGGKIAPQGGFMRGGGFGASIKFSTVRATSSGDGAPFMFRSTASQARRTRGSSAALLAIASLKPVLMSAGCRSTSRTFPCPSSSCIDIV